MTSEVNQKVKLVVQHFVTRNDEIFLDADINKKMAELFVSMTLRDGLFDERHIFTENDISQHKSRILECVEKMKLKEDGAESELFEAMANAESYKYRLEIPYEDITKLIYDFDGNVELLGLAQKFEVFEFALKDTAQKHSTTDSRKIEKAYKKFKRHLKLAVAQKDYFLSINKQAKESAELADQRSTHAKKTASSAKKAASEAKEISKKAKDMFDGMITNFVTILGVFATIIITVFGGINIVGATVKLLEGNNKLVYLVFVVSFLMICLLTLVKLLISWISSMKGYAEKIENKISPKEGNRVFNFIKGLDFYTKSILLFLIAIFASVLCIAMTYDHSSAKFKDNANSETSLQNSKSLINKDKIKKEEKSDIKKSKDSTQSTSSKSQ